MDYSFDLNSKASSTPFTGVFPGSLQTLAGPFNTYGVAKGPHAAFDSVLKRCCFSPTPSPPSSLLRCVCSPPLQSVAVYWRLFPYVVVSRSNTL